MKIKHFFIDFIFIFMLLKNVQAEDNPEWCWTAPDMKVKVVADKFGYNYGLCQASKGSATPESKIKVTLKMPNIKGFGGGSGPFKMKMASKEIQGDEFVLKEGTFKEDENYTTSLDVPSVGEVQTIEIIMDEKDTGNFCCDTVTIEDGPKNFEFKCSGVLDKKNKVMSITKTDTIEYDMTMVAGKEETEQTKDPIFVAIKGAKGITDFQIFSDEGVQIEPVNNKVELPDMGKFECVYVKTYGQDALLLKSFKLQATGGEPIEFKNEDAQKVECPENCQVAFCKGGPTPKSPPPPPPEDDPDAPVDNEDDSPQPEPASPYPDTMKFNCATLTVAEKENLKSLSCKTTAIQIFDEESFMNGKINYEMKYGVCPPNCVKDAICQGRGMHNPDSTICGAALADGSIPKSGGCVAIVKAKGLQTYGKAVVTNGIKVEMGSGSEWGFFTHKADNPDFSKSDIRILNHKGEPEYTGRVEFRLAGRWGTVNMKGTEQSSARFICKALNYIDGEWMNDPEAKDFCETYLDKDHCGFKGQPVHYMNYKCDPEHESLSDCYRQVSSEHNHKDDAIIKCSMEDKKQNDSVQPKQGQIRAIGTDGSPSQTSTGRVEMFVDGKWGTVCNKGFVEASAEVACKQLGFTGGKPIGGPGAHKACVIGKEDYCEKEGKKLIAEGFKCTGKEKQLTECGGNFKSACSKDQSAMIKCDGSDGDTSGNTPPKDGPPPPKVPRPSLGNLPISNPYILKCETTLNQLDFPGDPGSIYIGFCPPGCHNSDAILRGTSIYTHDSSICKAAIHAGVNQHKGGPVTIIATYGQLQYEGSLNRNVESVAFKYSKKSFMIAQVTSIHKKWSIVPYFAPFVGLLSQNQRALTQPPLKHNPTSFIQLKSKMVTNQMSKVAQHFRKYLQNNALLQLQSANPNRIFEWYSPKNFMFKNQQNTDYSDLEQNDDLQKMTKFTIMMQFEFAEDNGAVELFGHSECGCWGLIYDQDGLKFGEKCSNDNMVNLGQQIAKGKKYHIGLTYDQTSQTLILVVNGKTIYNDKHSMKFLCTQKVNIGYNSFSQSKYLVGEIFYINVFNKIIPNTELEEKTLKPAPSPTKNPKQGADTPAGQKALKSTQDGRKCVSPCVTDPFPEKPNSPEPPSQAALGVSSGGSNSEGATEEEAEEQEEAAKSDPEKEGKDEKIQNANCLDLHCDDTLENPKFQGEVDKQFCVYCPKGCWNTPYMVIGSQIYFKTSSICKAGIHDGKITDKEGGEFIVVLNNPIKMYAGSSENNVNSKELQVAEPTIGFHLKKPVKTFDLKCDQKGTDPIFENAVKPLKVKCPVKCSFIPNNVQGVGKYADTSSVCQAAIHSGALSDNGGEFQVQFSKGIQIYDESKKNEIKSSKLDNTKEQVKRSMVFIAIKADVAGFFKEKYEKDITETWQKVDNSGAIKGPSTWEFSNHPVEQEKIVLKQKSEIEVKKNGEYATKLFHNQLDADNALFKINIWQDKKSIFGIFFRYYDDNNYYVLKFNTPEESQILLIKKVAGVEKILGQYSEDIPLKQWNRLFIVFDHQQIEVYMQQGFFRNTPKILSAVDADVQRGKIALATNKEAEVYFDGIVVKPYDPNIGIMDSKAANMRTWDECLKPVNQNHRDKYCQKKNGNAKWAIPACKKLLNYCEYCCSDIIQRWERIIHYNCVSTCVKSTRRHEEQLRKKVGEGEEKPYIPKKGDKIDYMQLKIGKFIPAIVKEVKKGDEEGVLVVTVSYYVSDGEFAKDTLDYPDRKNRIQRCKKILTGRNDCGDQ